MGSPLLQQRGAKIMARPSTGLPFAGHVFSCDSDAPIEVISQGGASPGGSFTFPVMVRKTGTLQKSDVVHNEAVVPVASEWSTVWKLEGSSSDGGTISSEGSSDRVSLRSSQAARALEEEEEAELRAELEEVLNGEMYVDVQQLKDLSKYGLPGDLRSRVWIFLLGVYKPDRTDELSADMELTNVYEKYNFENNEVLKRVRGELKRYQPGVPVFQEADTRLVFEHTLSAYLSTHSKVEYSPHLVHLLGPLVACIGSERDVYYCFEALVARHEAFCAGDAMLTLLSRFLTLFRNLLPALCDYFEEEELEPCTWAVPWLHSLFCRELPLQCVLRLWDTYFSCDEGFGLHPFVCLSILETCTEELMEMDSTELLGFMQHLPSLDMTQVVYNAYNLQEKMIVLNLL
eukprot:TRINITY_DN10576_c0_g1_i1.p1 TRINITY_DN10576_c0_g1~~TRINITY_DN10576_c0_g1_i1.p1  ORF type:complete len:402 (+),score=81.04 TRINITY_DN10576_c0_g1_i1:253-1458(+)